MIALDAFPGGADYAFIATGLNFPDALAAGPATAEVGAPIILVNGVANTLDPDTAALIAELGVTTVFIVGGTPSVSAGIEAGIAAQPGVVNVDRISGANRFETSVEIAIRFFATSEDAYIATGLNFPDALAGGPLVASSGAPLYLSQQGCVPAAVLDDLGYLGAEYVTLLGGLPSLGAAVEAPTSC